MSHDNRHELIDDWPAYMLLLGAVAVAMLLINAL